MQDRVAFDANGSLKIYGTIYFGNRPEKVDYLISQDDELFPDLIRSFEIVPPPLGQEAPEQRPKTPVWNVIIGDALLKQDHTVTIRVRGGRSDNQEDCWTINFQENSKELTPIFGRLEIGRIRPALSSRIAGLLMMDPDQNLNVFIRKEHAYPDGLVPRNSQYQVLRGSSDYSSYIAMLPYLKPGEEGLISTVSYLNLLSK